jgi:excisionase family DNA binding protein
MQQNQILERLTKIESLLQEQQPKPLTLSEACRYIDCSKSYLYKLTSRGEIPHYKPNGKKVFFAKNELDAWLLRNPIKTRSQINGEAATRVISGGGSGDSQG